MEIAIYGKGGIGKSTVSANISASLAKRGKRVLQLGCDPKHDSTRLLLHGRDCKTVLDYMREVGPLDYQLADVVHQGIYSIDCVEAGGPEPGVGCAGRGILSTFELLENLGLDRKDYDFVLYDVLGDVVCGGFAVPLRDQYAEKVYIVTSGEFMSVYAANNILRGLANYSQKGPRAGGLIFNERGFEGELQRVERFAQAVGLPILGEIPRDPIFAACERHGQCVVEGAEDSPVALEMDRIAGKIWDQSRLYPAKPLGDHELEEVVLGHKIRKEVPQEAGGTKGKNPSQGRGTYSKALVKQEPLHGCAYNGAMNIAVQVKDAIIISHGPRSCANLSYQAISSLGRRSLFEKKKILPVQVHPKILSSELGEDAMVFGGIRDLRKVLQEALEKKPALVVLVTTCPSGIIGDDVDGVRDLAGPETPILALKTDGNLSGDYMQGMILAYQEIAKFLVDPQEKPDPYLVNLYGEKPIANATSGNFKILEDWLGAFGAKVHCRYLNETSTESVRTLLRAGLHLPAYHDYMNTILEDFFKKTYDRDFFPHALPIGYEESLDFIKALGRFYGKEEVSEKIMARERENYQRQMDKYRPYLQGKKLMVVAYNNKLTWILKTALDLGMDIVKVGMINFSQDVYPENPFKDKILDWEVDYTAEKRRQDVSRLKPDLVLANYNGPNMDDAPYHDTIQLTPEGGFQSGIALAKRWVTIFQQNVQEGWRKDEKYFKKYQG